MSKAKQGYVGKPSEASLKARGLSSSNTIPSRPGLADTGFSLYSTDSEDNVSAVNRGLDKCAELLTNILDIKSEGKAMKKSAYNPGRQQRRPPSLPKTKKEKTASKSGPTLKTKPRTSIAIKTGETRSNIHKAKTAYNERVVASTPVLTAEQRRHLQELQDREHALKHQIQLLQKEYENLEKQPESVGQTTQVRPSEIKHREVHEKTSPRRSLDFSNSAEKPFVENPVHNQKNWTRGSKGALPAATSNEPEKKRVQFETTAERNATEERLDVENKVKASNESSLIEDQVKETKDVGKSPEIMGETEVKREECSKPESPQRYADHLRILAYLVGELRAVLASSGDDEVDRLLTEIDSEVRLLTSYSMCSPRSQELKESRLLSPRRKIIKKQHDIDTEMALQPLRSENSDLRRKLRIANQKTKDMEEKLQNGNKNKEYPAEEGVVEHLHKQLFMERENGRKLRQEIEKAEKAIAQRNKDNSSLQDTVDEKDEEIENLRDELSRHKNKTTPDVSYQSKHQFQSMEMTVRAKNNEVELLKLAIEQRDAEIERLTELTRGLEQSLTRVLTNVQDLHPEDVLSDISVLSGIESWKPMTTKPTSLMPSMVRTTARVHPPETLVVDSDEELDIRTLQTGNREYISNTSSPVQSKGDRRTSIDNVSNDDTTISVSSADEFVFKQELANLDTIIARLQDSLRSK